MAVSHDIEGVATIKFTDVLSTSLGDARKDPEGTAARRAAFSKWLEDNDLTSLGTWSVHHSKIRSLTKERLAAGESIPDGVEVSNFVKVKLEVNDG